MGASGSHETVVRTPLVSHRQMPAQAKKSIDELLLISGGFGPHQRWQTAMVLGPYALGASTLLLPNFLLPRLMDEWSHFTKEDAALTTSLFFLGNTLGLIVWGMVADSWGRRPCTFIR